MPGFLGWVDHGLLGFIDSRLAPFGMEAFTVEILAVVTLTVASALCLVGSVPRARAGSTPAGTAT